MSIQITPWDAAEFLKTPEELALYIDEVLEQDRDSPAMLADTVSIAARVRGGVSRLSEESGIPIVELSSAMELDGKNTVNLLHRLLDTYQHFAEARKVA